MQLSQNWRAAASWAGFAMLALYGGTASAQLDATAGQPESSPIDRYTTSVPYLEALVDRELPAMVTALAEDSRGLIWIGNQEGLFRFDGYRVRAFRFDPADPHSLSGNAVVALAARESGELWIGTQSDGVSIFDPTCDCFQRLRNQLDEPASLGAGRVNAITSSSTGTVWIGTDAGLSKFDSGRRGFVAPGEWSQGLPKARVDALLVGPDGELWVGTVDGLYRSRPDSAGFQPVELDVPEALAERPDVTSLLADDGGRIWVGTRRHGAGWLDPGTSSGGWIEVDPLRADSLPNPHVISMALVAGQDLWLGTYGGGIARVDAADGRVVQRLHAAPSVLGALANGRIGALLKDRSGLLWIGTQGRGLMRFNPAGSMARALRHEPGNPASLSQSEIYSVTELRDGTLAVGTAADGFDIVDPARGRIRTVRPRGPDDLPVGIYTLLETDRGELWAGSTQGVFRVDASKDRWRQYTLADGLPSMVVRPQLRRADGSLVVGTPDGLAVLRAGSDRFEALPLVGDVLRTDFRTLAEDRDGRLWAASLNAGLWVLDPGARALVSIRADPARLDALSSDAARGLLVGRDGRLWIATSKGLERLRSWDGRMASFEHMTPFAWDSGLNFGTNLLEDAQGRIWSAETGSILDVASGQISTLGGADGIAVGTAWSGSFGRTRDGLFIFGGSEGLVLVDPARVQHWDYAPPVVATEISVEGRPEPVPGVATMLQLGPDRSRFSLQFAALDYSDPMRNRHAYRLLGLHTDWIEVDAQNRIASYGGLSPGDYTLEVRGSGRNGVWSPQVLRIPVRVAPAWFQTAWFAALVVLGLLTLGWAAIRWRTLRLRRQSRELGELVEARTAELRRSNQKLENAHAKLVDTQQQLVLQEKMAALGTLTAGVAHEINNPTNFADGAVQQLQLQHAQLHQFLRELAGADASPRVLEAIAARFDELQEMTATAREGHQRIKRIVADLRQFTRLDEAEKKSVPIADPIQSTVNLVRTRYDRIRFDLDLDHNPTIECQPAKLGQVFMNLIVNACEAIGECDDGRAGVVRIATRAVDRAVEIAIEDNGAGMDEATRQHVFEPFFTTKDVGSGTGLGLAIVFGIVREHGGSIEVESTPGAGTRFVLNLPIGSDG